MSHALDFLTHWIDPAPHAQPRRTSGNPERLLSKLTAARTLRQLRVKAGLSQQELAVQLELSVPEVVAIEIGEAECLRTLQVSERARKLFGA